MDESAHLSESYDYLFKFLVIGSAGTGKSCLLHQFIEGRFKEESGHTIGVEFGSKVIPVGGKSVKLQVPECKNHSRHRKRSFCLLTFAIFLDLGYRWTGKIPVSDPKLLQRSSRGFAGVRHHLQGDLQRVDQLADRRKDSRKPCHCHFAGWQQKRP